MSAYIRKTQARICHRARRRATERKEEARYRDGGGSARVLMSQAHAKLKAKLK